MCASVSCPYGTVGGAGTSSTACDVVSMIIRLLLALAALVALLGVLWSTGVLTDSQVADAEQQLLLRSEQQLVLARSAAATAQEHAAVHAYLDGDTGAQTSAQNWRAELDSLTADFHRLNAQ